MFFWFERKASGEWTPAKGYVPPSRRLEKSFNRTHTEEVELDGFAVKMSLGFLDGLYRKRLVPNG